MLNKTNVSRYLEVVSSIVPELSLSCLRELQSGHLANFCFSSLGVLLHKDLSLESQPLFDRLVIKKLGGYCFEHNRIFFEVLKSLGFNCELGMARVLLNRDIDVPRTHRITRLSLDGILYLVDVGFGPQCPRQPLLIETEEPQDQGDAVYRIIQPVLGDYYLQIVEAEDWFTLYRFDKGNYTEADCLCGHHYSSTYPEAAFVNNLVMSLKSYDDIRFIKNGEFQRIRAGQTATTVISSGELLAEIIDLEFGIGLTIKEASMLFQSRCK